MGAPPSSVTTGTGTWIWANPFGSISKAASIGVSNEVDQYRFMADQTGSYTISVSGGTVDSQLRVYNSSGNDLSGIIDHSFAGGTETYTISSYPTATWFYIDVTGFQTGTGSYTLSVSGSAPAPQPHISTTVPNNAGSASGNIDYGGDLDYISITAPSGTSTLNLTVTPSSGLDTYVELYNSSGTLIQTIGNGSAGSSGIADTASNISVSAGSTYYVGVSSWSSTATGSYTVNVDFNPDAVQLPVLSISALSADKAEGNGGGTTPFTFTVTRTGDTSGSSSVGWSVGANQSPAADASDFLNGISPTGTLTWNAGDSSTRTITVNVNADSTYEGGGLPDHFTVNLANASGATIGTATANGNIQNDDAQPQGTVLSISALSADKAEGNGGGTTPFTFTVTRTGDTSGSSSVGWSVGANQSPAADASDFLNGISPTGTLTWNAGDSSARTITVNVNADSTYEGGGLPDHFTVNLSNASGATIGTATANGNIQNDDSNGSSAIQHGIDFSHYEAISAGDIKTHGFDFVINYLGPPADGYLSQALANSYISAGLGIVSVYEVTQRFFDGIWHNYDPSVVGETSYLVNALTYDYGILDGKNAYNYAKDLSQTAGSAIYFAVDANARASISHVTDYFNGIAQGFQEASGGNPVYQVGVYGSGYVLDTVYDAGDATYKWLAAPTSWMGSSGYSNYDIWQEFNENQDTSVGTHEFAGHAVDHDVTSDGSFGQWGAFVQPQLSVLSISALSADKAEGNGGGTTPFTFTVTRTGSTSGSSSVGWSVGATPSPAADASDFLNGVLPTGTLTWNAGDGSAKTITVNVNADSTYEGGGLPEHFTVNLANASGATIGTATANGNIQNDDAPPNPAGSISIDDRSITEGNGGTQAMTFTVTRTGGTAAFDVGYTTSNNTATVADGDYLAKSGTLHFDAGVNTQPISVTINGDIKFEPDETFFVNLSAPTNGATISDSVGMGTIANDDTVFTPLAPNLAAFAPGAGGWSSNDKYPRELADVNGDGVADIVGFGEAGVYASLATGGGSFGPLAFKLAAFAPSAGGWSSDDRYPRELADVNGDHMADIVGFGEAGVYAALATGGGSFGPLAFKLGAFAPSAGGWSSDDRYPRELADVNGDGMADIVGFGEAGVYVALATGGGSFGPLAFKLAAFAPSAGGWSSDDRYPRELADVNGDHMADIVGFGEAGVYVALATGGGSFGPLTFKLAAFAPGAGGWTNNNTYPRELADVNADGKIDIVGFGAAGVYVAFGNGDGSFKPLLPDLHAFATDAGGWASEGTYPRHLADINHDGAADIVGFGQNGVYHALSSGFFMV